MSRQQIAADTNARGALTIHVDRKLGVRETHKRKTFWLDNRLVKQFEKFCQDEGISQSQCAGIALSFFIEHAEIKRGG